MGFRGKPCVVLEGAIWDGCVGQRGGARGAG